MTKKNIFLIIVVLLLGGLSIYLNKDRFKREPIQISHRSMAGRGGTGRNAQAADPVVFMFSRELKFTSIKVVLADDARTNRYPHAIWDLVGNPQSAPVKDFMYGRNIKDMKPADKGIAPDPLEPGITYRLLVEAASFKGEHDFVPVPKTK